MSRIDFGLLGMPARIQFTNGSVTEYIYAADGTKLRTIHRTSVSGPAIPYGTRHTLTNQETLSLDSITYIDGLEIDKFFNCKYYFDNGYLTLGNTGSGEYHYTIKDHLGNIRTVVDASGSAEQVNNYYAYGGLLNDVPASVDVQTHKYNGKELDLMHGMNEYDYGARQLDPAIGQFTSMDPLCEKYYHISPYAYCGGNPVNRVDPDGRDIYTFDETGHVKTQQCDGNDILIVDNSMIRCDSEGNEYPKRMELPRGTMIYNESMETDYGYAVLSVNGNETLMT